MKEAGQTSQQEKKLLNMIEIKMYDIAQNVQIIGKQLTNNQIKDTIAHTYSIFCQLKHTFQNAGLKELYEVIRKMQINSVALSSILTERIDKKNQNLIKEKLPQREITPPPKPQVPESEVKEEGRPKMQRLGGVCLYNESYMRGLEYYEVDTQQIEHQMTGKCRIKLSKKSRDDFLNSVSRQLDTKVEVEVETIGDQIKKYIKDYKQNSKINSFVSYEKELVEIIDFFKSSELQAMNFLNKSPKNQEYTQDYINRLNELENEFKSKQKAQKLTINQKLKLFIINLRQKLQQMEIHYQQKSAKLQLYEQSLKKQTSSIAIQTYDGLEARLKSQQNTIRQLEQRYKILSQIKNKQINFQSKYYQAQHEVNSKSSQITKLKIICSQLQVQIDYLKKIIRENKQKLNFDLKDLDRRKTKNRRVVKELSRKQIEQKPNEIGDSLTANQQQRQVSRRNSKIQKKSRRLQRVGAQTSSLSRPTEFMSTKQNFPQIRPSEEPRQSEVQSKNQNQQVQQTPRNKIEIKKMTMPSPVKQNQLKQSFFRNQSIKKNAKKTIEEERQVSFLQQQQQQYKKNTTINIIAEDNISQMGALNLSIDNIKNQDDNQLEGSSRKSKKNTLRQLINSSAACSLRSVQTENKKSSKSVSKKCIILKDNKEKDKSILATTIKFQNMSINEVVNVTVFPHSPQSERIERISYPFLNTQQGMSVNLIKSNPKLSYLNNDPSKKKLNQNATNYIQKIKQAENTRQKNSQMNNQQKNSQMDENKRRDYPPIFNKSMSKKQSAGQKPHHQLNHTSVSDFKNTHPRLNKPSNSSSKKNMKDITNYLQAFSGKNKELGFGLGQKLNSHGQQNWNTNDNSEPNSFLNYIIEELNRQELSLSEFKSIVNCIEETGREQESLRDQSSNNKKHQFNFSQEQGIGLGSKTIHNSKQNLVNTKRHSNIRQSKEEKNQSRQQKILKVKKDEIFGIGEHIYQNIRELHARISKCNNKDNEPCEHLIKYLSILKKVNQMSNNKPAIKLHIEKIGELLDINDKEYKKLQEPKNSEKLVQLIQKATKTSFNKSNAFNQQPIEQKNRILPIINSTTTSYYKGKVRLIK